MLITTPRRFGKTFSVSMFAAAMLYSTAGLEMSIYSTCKRISQKLLNNVWKFLKCIHRYYSAINWVNSKLLNASTATRGRPRCPRFGETARRSCSKETRATRTYARSTPTPLRLSRVELRCVWERRCIGVHSSKLSDHPIYLILKRWVPHQFIDNTPLTITARCAHRHSWLR